MSISLVRRLGLPLVLVALAGCHREQPRITAPEGPLYSAYAKGRVDVEGGLIRLASSRDGLIARVEVEEGEQVKKNTLLAVIDDREARLKLATAEAELGEIQAQVPALELRRQAAERDRARLSRLLKQDVAPQVQWEQADDLVKQLDAEKTVLEARIHLGEVHRDSALSEVEQHEIRAPRDGRIVRTFAHAGEGVSAQAATPLFLFEPSLPHIVRAELDERFVEGIHTGDDAEILLEEDESKAWKGKVLRIGQVFGAQQLSGDPNERADQRMVECLVSLGDEALRIGQRVMVRIPGKCPTTSKP